MTFAKYKLAAILAIILLISFISLSIANYMVSRAYIREEITESSLPLLRDTIFSKLQQTLLQPIYISSVMANDTFLKDWVQGGEKDKGKIQRYLQNIKKNYDYSSIFFVSATTKNYYHDNGVIRKLSATLPHDQWYYAFIASQKIQEFSINTHLIDQEEQTISIIFRVTDDNGKILGIAGAKLHVGSVKTIFPEYQNKHSRKIYLLDEKGILQAHSSIPHAQGMSLSSLIKDADTVDGIRNVRGAPQSFSYSGDNGQTHLSARYIPEIHWTLVVEQNEDKALISARRNLGLTISIGLGMTLLTLLISMYIIDRFHTRIEEQAVTDMLTNLPNRRSLEEQFSRHHARLTRHHTPFSMILLDLDKFKTINDTYGHITGDFMLKKFADAARVVVRDTDILGRWGGDEFLLLIDGNIDDALTVASRIHEAVEKTPLLHIQNTPLSLTISCGIADIRPEDSLEAVYARADKALYNAKKTSTDSCSYEY